MALDPGTPGSCPGLKADTQLLSHPGIPLNVLFGKMSIQMLCPYFISFVYLFMRDALREAKTQAEGEADSLQGA